MAYRQWNGGGYPGQQGGYPNHQRGFSGHQGFSSQHGGYPGQQREYSGPYENQGGPPGGHNGPSYHVPPPQFAPPQGINHYGQPVNHGRPPFHGHRDVPSAPQQFGQGAPAGYTFQYSNCSGRRKALLIGINYIGQKNELRGCINDVKNLSAFLIERYNYKYEDMVILTDDQSDAVRHPTKANIIRAMGWLVQGAQPGDSLFLHYSGHGGQTEDLDGDEDDGFDEVIYPVDFQTAGHIVDDNIHDMCVKPLLPGVRLTAIFDSCHSGTAMDLPYVYSTKGVLKEPNLAAEAGQGALAAFSAYASGDIGGVISSVMGFAKKAMNGDDAYNKTMATKTSPADVIMFSGSKDDQTSADAMIASEATGAMSWAFVTALKQNPQQTYVQLLNSIREVLETKYTQKPQLSCSHPLDTNILFIM
ncbi:Metacaspase-1 [Truncatella angustata]|uniref:Metacaspase-1 n=1 Tax=Truncatella angustata TaxID=152316 RepID=A0A9P8UM26_9PEZI|nr:Metacaspase-1 [Truncatella angustata]KAH6654472.1 Metacaspase-1 [Truncatella angustata]